MNFENQYNLVKNHLNSEAAFDGCLFETYGEELDYIYDLATSSKWVWTIIEGENENLYYVAGFHLVNRVGFLVTEEEWKTEIEEYLID